jgi:hypothetical protein
MNYFGTDLTSYGHYFWHLEGNQLAYKKLDFNGLPFSPEKIVHSDALKGTAVFCKMAGYSIYAIAGSCKDTRGGTKSVFWVEGDVEPAALKASILAVPIAKKMIEQMPFPVQW